jgi:hypothetical protein
MSNMITVSHRNLPAALDGILSIGRFPFIWGKPGIGKSQAVAELARTRAADAGLEYWQTGMPLPADPANTFAMCDMRTALLDALDVKGAPTVQNLKTLFAVPGMLPDPKVHGVKGILFLDELPQGMPSVTNALTQLIWDKSSGDSYIFPEGWDIIAAGNRKEDGAATNKLGSQVMDRFGHILLEPDVRSMCNYLAAKSADPRLIGFLNLRGNELLHTYKRGATVYATPRSWEGVADAFATIADPAVREIVVASLIGTDVAAEVEGFMAFAEQVPTWHSISTSPETANIPTPGEHGAIAASFAAIGMVGRKVRENDDNLEAGIIYVRRLPVDLQVVFALDIIDNAPHLTETLVFSEFRISLGNMVV